MNNKRGYTRRELESLSKQTHLRTDENVLNLLSGESDCDYWRYPFFAVNRECKYVLGFEDEGECDCYCNQNRYVKLTLAQACVAANKPHRFDNWTKTYPVEGLLT